MKLHGWRLMVYMSNEKFVKDPENGLLLVRCVLHYCLNIDTAPVRRIPNQWIPTYNITYS